MLPLKHAVVLPSDLLSCLSYKLGLIPTLKCKFKLNFHILSYQLRFIQILSLLIPLYSSPFLINYAPNTSRRIGRVYMPLFPPLQASDNSVIAFPESLEVNSALCAKEHAIVVYSIRLKRQLTVASLRI
jgi:hypothetical protein